jgi:hypothetical protein
MVILARKVDGRDHDVRYTDLGHAPPATWDVINPVADGGAWSTMFSETDALALLCERPDNAPRSQATDDDRTWLKSQK